jgi:predicted ATP-grasp superfamily ATP-dependent carboligase
MSDRALFSRAERLPRPAALVVGADCITGLQTARILARRGVAVFGAAEDPASAFARSRAFSGVARIGPGEGERQALVAELARRTGQPPVILPCTDDAVRWVSASRGSLAACARFALPAADTLLALMDKTRSSALAVAAGVAVPQTRVLRSPEDARAAAAELRFPCVLKPALRTPAWLAGAGRKVIPCADPGALAVEYERVAPFADEFVVQEWIPGGDDEMYSLYSVLDARSEPLAVVVAQKLRQWPPGTGCGSLAVERENPEVARQGLALLRSVGFRGPSSIQFKRDPRSGVYHFIEANVGRPALNEMIHTLYCDAAGLPLPGARRVVRPGAKWICWKMDLASAWEHRRRGELGLSGWLRSLRGPKWHAIEAWRDPLPGLLEWTRKLRGALASATATRPQRTRVAQPPARLGRPGAAAPDAAA